MTVDVTADWYWEGNVVRSLCSGLEAWGWTVMSVADTRLKQRGVDIVAEREGRRLWIEAKGYPAATYRDPRRAGEKKRTNPNLQAKHWFAEALLAAIRLKHRGDDIVVALAFPDFPRYRALLEETATAFSKLNISVFLVAENGDVATFGWTQGDPSSTGFPLAP